MLIEQEKDKWKRRNQGLAREGTRGGALWTSKNIRRFESWPTIIMLACLRVPKGSEANARRASRPVSFSGARQQSLSTHSRRL